MAWKVVVRPANAPITLAEAKSHLRVDHDDDDDLIAGMIEAATGYAEQFLGRALIDQTIDLYVDAFPASGSLTIAIPRPPLIEIEGVFYTSGGSELEFTGFAVDAVSQPARIYLPVSGSWPTTDTTPNAVRIRYRAGYLDTGVSPPADDVPKAIIAAIKLYLGTLYEQRETFQPNTVYAMPWGAENLLRMYRSDLSLA
jgi:uncharacterized phiE125 gp8 family phage protein